MNPGMVRRDLISKFSTSRITVHMKYMTNTKKKFSENKTQFGFDIEDNDFRDERIDFRGEIFELK